MSTIINTKSMTVDKKFIINDYVIINLKNIYILTRINFLGVMQ